MSTSTKATMPKPKRPLSGYNLFYRYKRNKVLEATARPNGRDRDNEAVIRAVLTALPGLEGVSPTSPLFRLCAVPVDEFRAAAIRKTMEGKLFPNENARKRVHCKVHGMGFVEMGRMMRQTWGRADKLTKDVFCELAEVGRARYRRLVAEYKLSIAPPENVKIKIGTTNGDAASAVAVCGNGTNRAGGLAASPARSFHGMSSAPELGGNSGGNKFASPFSKTTGAYADVTNARAQSLHRKNSAPELGGIPSPAISRPVGFTGTSDRGAANRGGRIAASAAASGPTTRHATPFHRMNSTPELGGNGGGNKFASPPSKTMGTYGDVTNARAQSFRRKNSAPEWGGTASRRWPEARAVSFAFRQAPSSSDPMLEAPSIWATKNPGPPAASASSESGNGVRASADLRFRAPATSDGPRRGRRASTAAGLGPRDASSFERPPVGRVAVSTSEPPAAETGGDAAGPEADRSHGRRASAEIAALRDGGSGAGGAVDAPAAFATGDGGAGSDSAHADLEALKTELDLQQSLLRNAIKNIKDRIIRNNSLLPTNMRVFPKEGIVPQDRVIGEKARLEITTSSGSSPLTIQNNSLLPKDMRVFPKEDVVPQDRVIGEKAHLGILTLSGSSALTGNGAVSNSDAPGGSGGNGPVKGEISARDFVEFVDDLAGFVDKMDEAIDDHTIKPVFNMPIPDSISVPVDIELKNNRARVA